MHASKPTATACRASHGLAGVAQVAGAPSMVTSINLILVTGSICSCSTSVQFAWSAVPLILHACASASQAA